MTPELKLRALEQQLGELQLVNQRQAAIIEKRSLQSFLEVLDGLDVVIRDAEAGREDAKQTLRRLNERLEKAKALGSTLHVILGANGSPSN